ncbi:MAG: N-acetylmuramoyl-L-alanine amidase [Lachnospiraceae bacterium]|nr:N-acetylmuramoyl-L-alanine amidase [Lachnospiraceae bacterium]
MTYSQLTNDVILTDKCNDRQGNPICKITPHHMAGVMSGVSCATYLANTARECSANYCIGVDGDIACNVEEENRAWTSSSWDNDKNAITIEVSDCDDDWNISDASWNALVNLCVDVCKRYGFSLNYTGDANGSLTEHRMFANTACPGEPLHNRMAELADTVNARLNIGISEEKNGVYRLYNPNTGEHFFTADLTEANNCANAGWSYEGVAWHIGGDVPVYRIYNPNDGTHMFTASEAEKNNLVSLGWTDEGIAFKVVESSNVAVYRCYNPNNGSHMFTASYPEFQHIIDCGWVSEGIGFYAE